MWNERRSNRFKLNFKFKSLMLSVNRVHRLFSNKRKVVGNSVDWFGKRRYDTVEIGLPKQTSLNNNRRKYESRRGVIRITSVNAKLE